MNESIVCMHEILGVPALASAHMMREMCREEGSGGADVMISSLVGGGRQELQAELSRGVSRGSATRLTAMKG